MRVQSVSTHEPLQVYEQCQDANSIISSQKYSIIFSVSNTINGKTFSHVIEISNTKCSELRTKQDMRVLCFVCVHLYFATTKCNSAELTHMSVSQSNQSVCQSVCYLPFFSLSVLLLCCLYACSVFASIPS